MENAIKAIIAFVVVGICIYGAVQLVPIYMDHWNFEDDIKEKVQFAFTTWGRDIEKKLKASLIKSLDQMGAEYDKKEIKITQRAKKITVDLWYSRSHNLPVLQNPKLFHIHVENTTLKNL